MSETTSKPGDRCCYCAKTSKEAGAIVHTGFTIEWFQRQQGWLCVRCLVKIHAWEQAVLKRMKREKREYCNLCGANPWAIHSTEKEVQPTNLKADIYKDKYQFACETCMPILKNWQTVYFGIPKRPNKEYPVIKRLIAGRMAAIGTGKPFTVNIVTEYWEIKELVVSAIYDQYVHFEEPVFVNDKFLAHPPKTGGHRYPRMSYEEVEEAIDFPRGSFAAMAIERTTALILFPEAPNNKKKDAENAKKREEYVEAHWRENIPGLCQNMKDFEARQRYAACDRRYRIFKNDPFLDKIKDKLIPRPMWFAEFLEEKVTAMIDRLHWVIDVDIIGESHQQVPQQLRALGHKVTTLSATKDFPTLKDSVPFVFHGSFEELNAVWKHGCPATTYGLGSSILRSHYTSYIPKDWFLNHDSLMTTWGNLESNSSLYDAIGFSWPEIFIRPDSGNKTFTGQCINFETFEEDKAKLESVSSIRPETIIWASSVKQIDAEYRIWISNGKVVTSSEYSWTKTLNKEHSRIIPEKVTVLANKIAAYKWQVDRIYVVDIAMYRKQAEIIEFNSFSCAGLYECDSETLFKTISEDILAEWNEE